MLKTNIWIATTQNGKKEHIDIATKEGVWGNKIKKRIFKDSKIDDILLLKTNSQDKVKVVALYRILGSPFESSENPWNDGTNYCNMIPIKLIDNYIYENKEIYKIAQECINGDGKGKKYGLQNLNGLNVPLSIEYMIPLFNHIGLTINKDDELDDYIQPQKSSDIDVVDKLEDTIMELNPTSGFIYAIKQNGIDNCFKVGFTKQSTIQRLKQLQTGNPNELVIVFEKRVYDVRKVERKLHTILDIFDCRKKLEWFEIEKRKLISLLTEITKS